MKDATRYGGIGTLVAAVAIVLTAVIAADPPLHPAQEGQVAGAALYLEHCAACHGQNLEGGGDWRSPNPDGSLPAPPHDETGHTWHHGDRMLFDYIKNGGEAALQAQGVSGFVSNMPGFGDTLSDQEIWHILAYIKSTWPERIREIQATRSAGEQGQGGT